MAQSLRALKDPGMLILPPILLLSSCESQATGTNGDHLKSCDLFIGCVLARLHVWAQWERSHLALQGLDCQGREETQRDLTLSEEDGRENGKIMRGGDRE